MLTPSSIHGENRGFTGLFEAVIYIALFAGMLPLLALALNASVHDGGRASKRLAGARTAEALCLRIGADAASAKSVKALDAGGIAFVMRGDGEVRYSLERGRVVRAEGERRTILAVRVVECSFSVSEGDELRVFFRPDSTGLRERKDFVFGASFKVGER